MKIYREIDDLINAIAAGKVRRQQRAGSFAKASDTDWLGACDVNYLG
jgi:hypothetical protein